MTRSRICKIGYTKSAFLAAFLSACFLIPAQVSAAIIKIQDAKSCQIIGLDTNTDTVQGGVHCDTGNEGFSLQAILDGDIGLLVGDSQTPSWNITNDTGAAVTSLPLYYSGQLASNSDIDMQVSGDWFTTCTSNDGINENTDASCGSGDKTVKPEAGGQLPVLLTWDIGTGTGVGIGETFNLGTASFAHAGQDAGCISGTATCNAVVPIPAAVWLFGSGLFGLIGIARRKTAV